MSLKPLDFYILVVAAIRDRWLEDALDAEHDRYMAEEGLLNPDGSLSIAAIMADTVPLDWSEYDELRHDA